MEKKYVDFLLVEKQDGSLAVVVVESHTVHVGYIVAFNNGELGRVVMATWGGEQDGEMHDFIASLVPTYDAEEAYSCSWTREVETVETHCDAGSP